jgi:hypothetical protein
LFGGGNDIMTHGTVARSVDHAVGALTALAPTVLFTLSDISRRMPFGRRIEALNAAIREAAISHGALLVDLWPDPAVDDPRYFGPDRLHLAEHGHRRLAAHLLASLGLSYEPSWLEPLPGVPARPSITSHARWARQVVWPVVRGRVRNKLIGRQPGDGFLPKRPELLPVSECQAVQGNA